MSRLGSNLFSPCGLAGRAKPVDIIKIELSVHITEPDICTEFQQVLAGVVDSVQVACFPVFVVLADNGHPVGQQHIGRFAFRYCSHLRIEQGFCPFSLNIFRLAECLRILPPCFGRCFRHEVELQKLVLMPAVYTTVKKQG